MTSESMSFSYCSRRALEEEIAAINATSCKASAAHRTLSRLHTVQALEVLLNGPTDGLISP